LDRSRTSEQGIAVARDGNFVSPTFATGRDEARKSLKKSNFIQKVCTMVLFWQ
jgi:hypothetical protein